ncbi:MAG: dTDP-4-dehydrorhamnose 3,5-epimerase [Chloroflexi bacterium]|nr:dTDP-4-dehydrorhamnose 3,5-epimerase [Chloroflexota bacterium]
MKFIETALKDAYIVEPEPIGDERGFLARSFCREEFIKHGLNPEVAQCNTSYSKKKGTLRGMHYQAAPHEEAKLVRCIKGSVYDVIIDLRSGSPAYCKWTAVTLAADNFRMLYVPEGFAHGFKTLEDDTVLFYLMSDFYHPESSRGIRWDDPAFNIEWPETGSLIVSDKDKSFPEFSV